MNSLLLKVCLLLAVFATGCSKVTIETPVKDAVYPDSVPDFTARWDQPPATPLVYTLNGADVTAFFIEGEDNTATASGADMQPYLVDGKNILRVTSATPVPFFYDISGPTVHITSVTGVDSLEITGYVEDPMGVALLTIEGNPVDLDENNGFVTTLVAQPRYDFAAEDTVGHIREDDFIVSGEPLTPSIVAKVNESGLPAIADIVNGQIAGLDLTALLASVNPIFDQSIPLTGTGAVLNVSEVESGVPSVNIEVASANNNSLDIHVEIPDFVTYVAAEGTLVFIPWTSSGNISADLAIFDINASVSVVDGEFAVTINDVDSNLQGFGFDIVNFPDVLEALIDALVKPLIELIVSNRLEAEIPEKIEEVVSGIIPGLNIVLNDTIIYVETSPEQFAALNQSIDLSLTNTAYVFASAEVPEVLGSVYADTQAPVIESQTPDGQAFDFAAGIGVNFFNQILLGSYQGGIFNIVSDAVDSAGTITRVEIVPSAAPYLTLLSSQVALGKLNFLDFEFRFLRKRLEDDDFVLMFGAELNLKAPFNLGVDAEQKLAFSLDATPEVQVLNVEEGATITLGEGFVQQVLDSTIPNLLPLFTQGLEGFELPSLAGASLSLKQIWSSENLGFILIAGDLEAAELSEE
ncbi:MAG: hypothetical protein MI976_26165 [Pseudomonadales bacterium]|nr:hypothetical protein [Pseudomonadales bacterium]